MVQKKTDRKAGYWISYKFGQINSTLGLDLNKNTIRFSLWRVAVERAGIFSETGVGSGNANQKSL